MTNQNLKWIRLSMRRLRQFVSGGGRVEEIALIKRTSVAGGLTQDLVELVLVEGAHKVADHVEIVANVE